VFEAAVSVDSARRGIGTALQNIREASYGDDGSYPISNVATSSVTFYSDVDADGGVERVRIYIDNNVLYRVVTNSGGNPSSYTGQAGATSTIIANVRNGTSTALFTYFDSAGAALPATSTDVSEIRSVAATLMIDLNPQRAPNVLTLTGSATLRNLRSD
jgi:flagellar hook assembly protein FlgD